MKALTLTQPWSSLVSLGAKKIETRTWRTNYRGPLAIHAAKGFPQEARDFVYTYECRWALSGHFGSSEAGPLPDQLPRGCVLCVCKLVDCVPMEVVKNFEPPLSDRERAFGDYSPGRFAWVLAEVDRFDKPVPSKGALGLWEWDGKG